MKPFVLELLDQSWVDSDPRNVFDGCSHGNIIKVPTTDEATALRFPEADTSLTLIEYGRPILQFADDVARFFPASRPRRFPDNHERAEFESFIREFGEKREMARVLLR